MQSSNDNHPLTPFAPDWVAATFSLSQKRNIDETWHSLLAGTHLHQLLAMLDRSFTECRESSDIVDWRSEACYGNGS